MACPAPVDELSVTTPLPPWQRPSALVPGWSAASYCVFVVLLALLLLAARYAPERSLRTRGAYRRVPCDLESMSVAFGGTR